jgi:hypothetical protein
MTESKTTIDKPDIYTEWELFNEHPHERWRNDEVTEATVTGKQLQDFWKWLRDCFKK